MYLYRCNTGCRGAMYQLLLPRFSSYFICTDYGFIRKLFKDGKIKGGVIGKDRPFHYCYPPPSM